MLTNETIERWCLMKAPITLSYSACAYAVQTFLVLVSFLSRWSYRNKNVDILSTAAKTSCSTIAFLADALNGWIFSWVSLWCQWPVWIHRSNLAYAVAGLTLKPELGSRKQKAHLLTWLYLESCCSEYWKSTKYYHRQNVSTQGISLNLLQFNIRR